MSNGTSFTRTQWLIIIVASIGFLFDTYILLMTPLVGPPAISEFLKVPVSDPQVSAWMGRLLWMSALCGGIFGLLGGWFIDKLGRKTVMAAGIFLYSFSPVAGAYCNSLEWFIVFRCTSFIGVCVEFVAAITWLAEVFEDRKVRTRWLGITQTFASLGGVLVTVVSAFVNAHATTMPALGMPVGVGGGAPPVWRYLLLSGLLPAIPIALLLPFVPESKVWKEKRAAGTLRRPSFGALFAPNLRRVTLLTMALSACAYAIAFGALQITVGAALPALPDFAPQAKEMVSLRKNLADNGPKLKTETDPAKLAAVKADMGKSRKRLEELVVQQQEVRTHTQFFQEMGGLVGRIGLAVLLIVGLSRRLVLRILQIPAALFLPVTYFYFFPKGGENFLWAYADCAFFVVAQFSYFGEYLPKVFPIHLRGTGGSFATNVGGRMIGTSAAMLTTGPLAALFAGGGDIKPIHIAQAAGWLATVVAILALVLGYFLPEPKEDADEVSSVKS